MPFGAEWLTERGCPPNPHEPCLDARKIMEQFQRRLRKRAGDRESGDSGRRFQAVSLSPAQSCELPLLKIFNSFVQHIDSASEGVVGHSVIGDSDDLALYFGRMQPYSIDRIARS